jgi:choline dehydrogenase-like flavoprotein
MLSGVGPAQELARLGIQAVQHLPGVGRNLQDHPDFVFGYSARSLDTIGVSLGGGVRMLGEILRFRRERRGMLTTNFAEGGGFLKTRPELEAPDIQLHFVVAMVDNHARRMRLGHGFSCHVCLLRPRSRGAVTLRSNDPLAAPLIDPPSSMTHAMSKTWWPASRSRAGSCRRPHSPSGPHATSSPRT